MSLGNQRNLVIVVGVAIALLAGTLLLGGYTKIMPAASDSISQVEATPAGCSRAKACAASCDKPCGAEQAEKDCCPKPCPTDCTKPCCAEEAPAGCSGKFQPSDSGCPCCSSKVDCATK